MTVPPGAGGDGGESAIHLPAPSTRERWRRRQSRVSDPLRKILDVFKPGDRRDRDRSNAGSTLLIYPPPDTTEEWQIPGRLLDVDNNTIPVIIALDTQSEKDLISSELQTRLHHELKPCGDHERIITLHTDPTPVHGVLENIKWQGVPGQKTYVSDFRVVHTDHFDVIIGKHTINKYRLVEWNLDM
ncbi:hypothetical protein P168DRAFT_186364 [Aspergillus campestris IBT 28561]|uniref:Uncharacterized protein n=1 Tax=Aspergillus campestris (strain IBT 28561) TaxID=1392248 RepID=A0A2I1CY49_ASPC2|nr:uncharacterized protein P168DRAFT_186364 [Aspergillus campestris IBT 28561]PKY02560.1 hypothetical protein P168DRAFT_186364 [Aspergillus campestris IBT 28561]